MKAIGIGLIRLQRTDEAGRFLDETVALSRRLGGRIIEGNAVTQMAVSSGSSVPGLRRTRAFISRYMRVVNSTWRSCASVRR